MTQDEFLTVIGLAADGGAILAGLSSLAIAISLAGRRLTEKWALEAYLKKMTSERQRNGGQGLENVLEVMRQTKLGEEAIMRAAFSSRKILVRSRVNAKSQTEELVFGYGDHDAD